MAIKVTVKNGEAVMEVEGVEGPGCKDIMEAAMKASQLNVTREDPKDEFYAKTSADATQSEGQ